MSWAIEDLIGEWSVRHLIAEPLGITPTLRPLGPSYAVKTSYRANLDPMGPMMAAPRSPIDLGVQTCPMDPEGISSYG
jgi:hypothetical protein